MNSTILFGIVDIVAVLLLTQAIYNSQRRWLSFGYAILGFAIPFVLGLLLVLVISAGAVDIVGTGITLSSPFAAVLGAYIPPRRKAQA
jgi:hypothetical protein